MFKVHSGSKNERQEAEEQESRLTSALITGAINKTIYQTGGSQTRRESFEDWKAIADAMGCYAERIGGWKIVIRSKLHQQEPSQ